ncbi:MAG: arylamine N-acetyltransferase family protein [Gaiellales bacterium]
MDVAAYLARIGHHGSTEPRFETLAALHRAHMLSVPFENLDIHRGAELVLDREQNVRKIVEGRRGGWCYELNGAFSLLLERLGFRVSLLGASVGGDPGLDGDPVLEGERGPSPELAHLMLRVDLERPYIADVGFGESPLVPLALDEIEHRVVVNGGLRVTFDLQPRSLDEFEPMCRWQQTSPESHFVQRRVCTMATPEGRITLSDLRLIERTGDRTVERDLSGEEEWRALLAERFGMRL